MIAPIIAAGTLGGLALRSRRRKKNSRVVSYPGSFAPQTRYFGPGESPRVQAFSSGVTYPGSTAIPAGTGTGGTGGTTGHRSFRRFFFYPSWGWGWWPWWYNPYYQTSYAEPYACLRFLWVNPTPPVSLSRKEFRRYSETAQTIGFVNIAADTQRRVALLWNDVTRRGEAVDMASAADIATMLAGCSPNLNSRYDVDVLRSIRDIGLITQ